MSLDSSPSDIQCTRTPESREASSVISGSVSSLMATTTTLSPLARAASSTRKGNRPLPAIKPRGEDMVSYQRLAFVIPNAVRNPYEHPCFELVVDRLHSCGS